MIISLLSEKHISLNKNEMFDVRSFNEKCVYCETDSPKLIKIEKNSIISVNSIPNWRMSNNYVVGDIVQSDKMFFECIKSGVSGKIEPNWHMEVNIINVNDTLFIPLIEHKSSNESKPFYGKSWERYWKKVKIQNAWFRSWQSGIKYKKNIYINDGNDIKWIKRFKKCKVDLYDKKNKLIDTVNLTIVPWKVNNSCFIINRYSSFIRNHINIYKFLLILKRLRKTYYIFTKLIQRLFIRENLILLASENKSGENIFFVKTNKKGKKENLYSINQNIYQKPKLLTRFNSIPEYMKITPFGYFVILSPKTKESKRTIWRTDNLKKWELVHTLYHKGNYILPKGWEYDYDIKSGTGILYVNEKNNFFPTKSAIVSRGIFKKNEKGRFSLIDNELKQHTDKFSKFYEFPKASDEMKISIFKDRKSFFCKKTHLSSKENRPIYGNSWKLFWNEIEYNENYCQWISDRVYLSSNDRLSTRHLHSIHKDPFSNLIVLGTGDLDKESHLLYFFSKFDLEKKETSLSIIGSGSQKWRTTAVEFTKKYIYWGMDSQYDKQSIYRIEKSKITNINNGNIDDSDIEIIATIPDKSFISSISFIRKKIYYIIFVTAYEVSKYNIDDRARVFCIKEFESNNIEISEIASFSATPNSFGKLLPISVDDDRCVFFTAKNLRLIPHNMILDTKIK